jgi:hypothetical protein
MGAVGFVDIRIFAPSGYRRGSVGLPTRLLEIESDGKVAS